MRKLEYSKLEEEIGYIFQDKKLLQTALTHTSYAYEKKTTSNEKLEFLGDSILEFLSSIYIYNYYPKLKEGEMTKVRAQVVCEASLYKVAMAHNFSDFLRLGKSERSGAQRTSKICYIGRQCRSSDSCYVSRWRFRTCQYFYYQKFKR